MRVRLVSYNIMTGGEGRADPIAEVLLGQHADIIGIHEADDPAVLRRLAYRLNMEFVVASWFGGTAALFTRHRIVDSANIGLLHRSTLPMLDATIRTPENIHISVRVARLTHSGEADRMAERLRDRVPMVMLMSHDPPIGRRVIDGIVHPADQPAPTRTHVPVRQLDDVLVRPDVPVVDTWIEQDRLAYYASDHLPAGAEIELA